MLQYCPYKTVMSGSLSTLYNYTAFAYGEEGVGHGMYIHIYMAWVHALCSGGVSHRIVLLAVTI